MQGVSFADEHRVYILQDDQFITISIKKNTFTVVQDFDIKDSKYITATFSYTYKGQTYHLFGTNTGTIKYVLIQCLLRQIIYEIPINRLLLHSLDFQIIPQYRCGFEPVDSHHQCNLER